MAVFRQGRIQIRESGQTVTIPNNPTARLMYYLDCVGNLLDLEDANEFQRYRNYSSYYNMRATDKDIIVKLCLLLNPKLLINQCMFIAPELCGSSANKFFEITASEVTFATVDNIVIGGVSRRVNSIMALTPEWLNRNYLEPIETLLRELTRTPTPPPPPRLTYQPRAPVYNNYTSGNTSSSSNSSCCNIL